MTTTAVGGYSYLNRGFKIEHRISHICSPYRDGMTHLWRLTELTWIKDTNRGIYGLSLRKKMSKISAECTTEKSNCDFCANEFPTSKPVYDITNAGPRNRFVVVGSEGNALVVHNCILGLGFQMGASKFKQSCVKDNIILSDEEAARIVKLYRSTYSKISSFWWNLEKAAIRAVRNPNSTITLGHLKFKMRDGNLRMRLPCGRALNYPNAKVVKSTTPWGEQKDAVQIMAQNALTRKWEEAVLTPGILAENATQATARDVMIAAMFRAEEHGYPMLLTVHDELIAETDADFGSVKEFEKVVSVAPDWAVGLPIKSEGWRNFRYKK
jgi:hypothetical protein